MKKGGNELMALKHHYLGCIVQEAQKTIDRQNPEKKSCEVVELTAKKLLKTNKEGKILYNVYLYVYKFGSCFS